MIQHDVNVSHDFKAIFTFRWKIVLISRTKDHDEDLHALHGHEESYIGRVFLNKPFELEWLLKQNLNYRLSDDERSLLDNFRNEKYLKRNKDERQAKENVIVEAWSEHHSTLHVFLKNDVFNKWFYLDSKLIEQWHHKCKSKRYAKSKDMEKANQLL